MSEQEKTVIKKTMTKKERQKRAKASPGQLRTKMTVSGQEPGFHYAFINEDNVGKALDDDYEFVTHPVTIGHKHVDAGTIPGGKISLNVGNGVVAYLMRIPQEWYEENQNEIQEYVDFTEKQLYIESNSNGLSGAIVSDKAAWEQGIPDLKYKA